VRPQCIILEGTDGVGKTTVAKLLADDLNAKQIRCPGGHPFAEKIRELIKSDEGRELSSESVLHLMTAADLLAREVADRLVEDGETVIMDRCMLSNGAYRYAEMLIDGGVVGSNTISSNIYELAMETIYTHRWAPPGSVVVLLTASVETCRLREKVRQEPGDRFGLLLEGASRWYKDGNMELVCEDAGYDSGSIPVIRVDTERKTPEAVCEEVLAALIAL
jgi:thymidylate kinase